MVRERRSMRLLLVRSCETEWELQGRVRGATELPLSPLAVEQLSRALADPPELDVVRHATDEVSKATASLLAGKTHARRRKVQGIEPPDLGLLEGLTLEEANERYPSRSRVWEEDPLALLPPEGEPLRTVAWRSGGALVRTLSRSRSTSLAIVAHPVVIGMLRLVLAGSDEAGYHELERDAGRLEPHEVTPEGFVALRARVEALAPD